ncbi:MAG: hypothetical protein PHW24_00700 [Candidatus Moranbacteria bacterium]|nr:hypothetical protein [Candidatus Moranbacteria bacterium]
MGIEDWVANPGDPKYKKVEDLPEVRRSKFKDVDGGFVQKTAKDESEITESYEELHQKMEKQNRKLNKTEIREKQEEFIEELNQLFAKFDKDIRISKEEFEKVHVLSNGQVSGYIYQMEVNRGRMYWYDNMRSTKVDLDYRSVLDSIAFVLQKHGVRVFDDNGHLIVIQKHDDGDYDDIAQPNMHTLYSRGDFFGSPQVDSHASIFSDGMQFLGTRKYDNVKNKLTLTPHVWGGRGDEAESYEVPEFSKTEEEIIKRGNEMKYRLETNARERYERG